MATKKPTAYAFVEALVRLGSEELVRELGTTEGQADEVMHRVARRLVGEYARTELYVPSMLEVELFERAGEISRKFGQASETARAYTAARCEELAREYGLTVRSVYRILQRQTERENADRQGVLALDEDAPPPAVGHGKKEAA